MTLIRISTTLSCFWVLAFSVTQAAPPNARATPTPRVSDIGYIRVWDFASSFKIPIDVSLTGAGTQVLARSMSAGRIGSYASVHVGQYRLSVRAAASGKASPSQATELIPPININVTNTGFQTLILRDSQGTPRAFAVNDTPSKVVATVDEKRLRVFNFADGQTPALRAVQGDDLLWEHVPNGMSEHFFPANVGAIDLAMVTTLPNGHEVRQIINANFRGNSGVSVVIFIDRYGRLSFQGFEDGRD